MTLAEIRRIHDEQHGGYIGECTCKVDGKLCQVVYREAEGSKSDRQIQNTERMTG